MLKGHLLYFHFKIENTLVIKLLSIIRKEFVVDINDIHYYYFNRSNDILFIKAKFWMEPLFVDDTMCGIVNFYT